MPRLISLSLRPTAHHRHFQLTCVRSFTEISHSFNLAMGRSRGFGSTICYWNALFRLAFATPSVQKTLSLQHIVTSRSIMQKVRRHPFISEDMHRAPTACKSMISGSISLPSPGFFSTFPHGTSSLSVRRLYLGLGLQHTVTSRSIMQKVRRHPFPARRQSIGLRPLVSL